MALIQAEKTATKMRRLTDTRAYRKIVKEIQRLQNQFSDRTHVTAYNINSISMQMLIDEGFKVERNENIKEYDSYKISW